jgi:hypothetical protein
VFGTGIVVILTAGGIFMSPISVLLLATVAAVVAILYFSALDWLKIWLFRRLELR